LANPIGRVRVARQQGAGAVGNVDGRAAGQVGIGQDLVEPDEVERHGQDGREFAIFVVSGVRADDDVVAGDATFLVIT
jgi:hypothetical protein